MKRVEAIREMLDGKKIRGKNWKPEEYAYYDKESLDRNPFTVFEEGSDGSWEGYWGTDDTEFEIYHPPKTKVDMWLWAYQLAGRPSPTNNFYATEEEAEEATGNTVIKLDWSKTPFEVE